MLNLWNLCFIQVGLVREGLVEAQLCEVPLLTDGLLTWSQAVNAVGALAVPGVFDWASCLLGDFGSLGRHLGSCIFEVNLY